MSMPRSRSWLLSVSLPLLLVACSGDDTGDPSGSAASASSSGVGGNGSTSSGTGGAGQGGTGGGGSCAAGGPESCEGPACACTAKGLVPISDLGTGSYQGRPGGLYGSGNNSRPPAHEAAGLALAQSIGPLDAGGAPDPAGRYVFLSIGMSNTTQEFSVFVPLAMSDQDRDPALVVLDGAQSGVVAPQWADPNSPPWDVVNQRLAGAGLTPAQVAVAWVKTAIAGPQGDFQQHADLLQGYMVTIAQNLRAKFPNLKLAYYSSRIYAGYAEGVSMLNPEPYAYESGFSVQGLVLDQIGGAPELAFEGASPQAPWLSWGPYLWADGMNPRCDGLTWACSDLNNDGTHPSQSGRQKVAQMLLDFVKSDTTAREWFLAAP